MTSLADYQTDWSPVPKQGSFQIVPSNLSATVLCGGTSSDVPIIAGTTMDCNESCTGGMTSASCTAVNTLNDKAGLYLVQKHGTYWAKMNSQPKFIQARLPVPTGASSVTLRATMDNRYPPAARGGNPCAAGSASHACQLCTAGIWDHAAPPGIWLLWSYPGRASHAITPAPVDVYEKFKAGELKFTVDSPPELDLTGQPEVAITFFAFSQYPYTGELEDGARGFSAANPSKCSVEWTKEAGDTANGNILLGLTNIKVITRSKWDPPAYPTVVHPRIFGNDSVWYAKYLAPFYSAPCLSSKSNSVWSGGAGFPSFKGQFQVQTLGYSPCWSNSKVRQPTNPCTTTSSFPAFDHDADFSIEPRFGNTPDPTFAS